MVLYRKYRPKNFKDIIGQHHITQTLSNAILNNSLGHAYLFTGPRGTGKTSIARILARAVNCLNLQGFEPCNKCTACQSILKNNSLDLIEVDAASNRRIDEMRLLQEQTKLKPIKAKYKVFIIDEVHMLTREAFNALLKTLEEPPPKVLFILATTEVHKVPQTILSRVQRFDLKLLNEIELKKYLDRIFKKEKIKLDQEIIEFIITKAQGSARDALSILEQIINFKGSSAKEIKDFFGILDQSIINNFIDYLLEKNGQQALVLIYSLAEKGFSLENFIEQTLETLQKALKEKIENKSKAKLFSPASARDILKLITLFLEAKNNHLAADVFPTLPLEISIAKFCEGADIKNEKPETKENTNYNASNQTEVNKDNSLAEKIKDKASAPEQSYSVDKNNFKSLSFDQLKKEWPQIIEKLKSANSGFAACFSFAQPLNLEGNKLTVAFQHNFHCQFISKPEKKNLVEQRLKKILQHDIIIKPILAQKKKSITKKVLEVFGGEVIK